MQIHAKSVRNNSYLGIKPLLFAEQQGKVCWIRFKCRWRSNIITVRVLKGKIAGKSSVDRPLVLERLCERLEVFIRFAPSTSFAKLTGCMLESSFLPNSPT